MAAYKNEYRRDVEKTTGSPVIESHYDSSSDQAASTADVYDSSQIDPILSKKMALVNTAIDEIGMTPFQWKLFFFNGFGYAVDSVSRATANARTCLTRA